MPQDLYQYETMIDRALRGVVREALERAAREGLRGAHHFYVGFATEMPGVSIPDSLRERYPQEMTIVLQHQYWDLEVGQESFSVTLSFQKQLERLTVPFAAVRSFADPSVNFALEFAPSERGKRRLPWSRPHRRAGADPDIDHWAGRAARQAGRNRRRAAAEKTGAEVVTLDSFRKR